jgi:DNA-binding transcriptional MerR regulator
VSAVPARGLLSIGEVLSSLRPEFHDVTISKIRFLESEGLVTPTRTASGYRKFTHSDVERLRYVLAAQRDRYLPLKVIRDELDAIDRGMEPTTNGARVPRALVSTDSMPGAQDFRPDHTELRLSRQELLDETKIDESTLAALEEYALVGTVKGTSHYDGAALAVCRTVTEMTGYGIEPRHLRSFKVAADREVGLVQQVITPLLHQRNAEGRSKAEDVARELSALSVRLHTALVQDGLARELGR